MLYLTVFYFSAEEKLPPNSYYEGLAVYILKKSGLLNNWGSLQDHFTGEKEKKKDTNTH